MPLPGNPDDESRLAKRVREGHEKRLRAEGKGGAEALCERCWRQPGRWRLGTPRSGSAAEI